MIPERRLKEEAQAPIRKVAPRTRPGMGRFVTRLMVTVGIAIFAVSRFAVAAQAGYQLDSLRGQLTVAQAKEANLKGRVAMLTSTQRLVAEAPKLKLGSASTVLAVSVPSAAVKTATPVHYAKRSGFLKAIGAVIQAIADEVARM
ncbi:MAG: hypothetical protein M0Z66_10875 [Thermaerobacter sp.]|nr:hypothetical protein [Thermaerobacter sp.]